MFSKARSLKVESERQRFKGDILSRFLSDSIRKTAIDRVIKLESFLGKARSIVEKGENAAYQHFLLFQQCFLKLFFAGSLKVEIERERFKGDILLRFLSDHYTENRYRLGNQT